jgi:hypothetical protein
VDIINPQAARYYTLVIGLLALTGVTVRTPSDWHNTVIDDRTIVTVEVTDPHHRTVRVETNAEEVTRVSRVRIACDDGPPLALLFDRT